MLGPLSLTLGSLALLAAIGCQSTTEAPTAPAAEPSTSNLAVAGALVFREVSAGNDHTCGVTSENAAYCWGSNSVGQLGDGASSQDPQTTPELVVGTVKFRSVSAGNFFSCGLGTGFRAQCWGANDDGQLGDGSTQYRETPTQVASGLRVPASRCRRTSRLRHPVFRQSGILLGE